MPVRAEDLGTSRGREQSLAVAAAPSPPGSSRRAGGYSPVLRLTADEMSLPFIPLSQKVHLLGHDSTAEGDILGQGSAPARSRTPQGRFPPARLLHPGGRCGTGGTGKDPPARLLLPGGLTQEAALVAVCVGCWPLKYPFDCDAQHGLARGPEGTLHFDAQQKLQLPAIRHRHEPAGIYRSSQTLLESTQPLTQYLSSGCIVDRKPRQIPPDTIIHGSTLLNRPVVRGCDRNGDTGQPHFQCPG